MKKQSVIKKLHKPVHPILGKIVLGACIIVIVCAIVIMFEQQPVSPTSTRQSTPPTPTSILAQSPPSVTPILLPIDTWETFTDWKCNYPYSIKLPTKLTVNNELSSKCFTGLGSSNTLYNFTIKVGYSWGVDATTIPPVCGSDGCRRLLPGLCDR